MCLPFIVTNVFTLNQTLSKNQTVKSDSKFPKNYTWRERERGEHDGEGENESEDEDEENTNDV